MSIMVFIDREAAMSLIGLKIATLEATRSISGDLALMTSIPMYVDLIESSRSAGFYQEGLLSLNLKQTSFTLY